MWAYPALLLVPNVALCFTEHYSLPACAANILLPAGLYLLLCASWRKLGRTVLLCTPFSIYAAFQIVLLFLYGESIIAIDMFLNVATTNVGEATELLANLGPAIATVIALYLPPIAWAIVLIYRRRHTGSRAMRRARRTAWAIIAAGIAALAWAYLSDGRYAATRNLFPLNVAHNTAVAVQRYHTTRDYPATSSDYRYDARSTRPDSLAEVYVLVVGETCRADNWQLLGYSRATNPCLSKRTDIVTFSRALSESNTTHKSVPLMLSPLTADNFGDSIYNVRSIFEAFSEAGYNTAFFSNQQRNGSFIDFFGQQADTCVFIADNPDATRSDSALVPMLESYLAAHAGQKVFAVLHSYGSHFNYRERYPESCRHFTPDNNETAERSNRDELINAYDNTIVATDAFVNNVIESLTALPDSTAAAMLFVPDHGEDIFDDDRERFLHASPAPTYWQIHVPMVLWTSAAHSSHYPSLTAAARANADKDVASSRAVFDTMLSLAGILTPHANAARAVTDTAYTPNRACISTTTTEGVELSHAGLHPEDTEMLDKKGISWH